MKRRRSVPISIAMATTFLLLQWQSNVFANPVTATMSDTFANSIGINVKLRSPAYLAPTSSYLTFNNAMFLSRIHHIREGVPLPTEPNASSTISEFNFLAANGVKTNMLFYQIPNLEPTQQQSLLDLITPIAPAIEAAEGPNEGDAGYNPNNPNPTGFLFNNKGFPQSVIDFQNVLWSAIKGSSQYSSLPVIAPSIGYPPNSTYVQGMQYVSDYANTHSYHGARNPGTTEVNLGLQNFYFPYAYTETANKPVIATETGNWVGTQNYFNDLWMPAITPTAQEKYAMRGYAEYFISGIQRTYVHELLCEPNAYNVPEQNFGFLNSNWSERPAFTALKHLTALIGDPGSNFSTGQLNYTLSGATSNIHQLLLQKRDGTFYLVLWHEVSSYDYNNLVDITVPTAAVTLNLTTSIAHAAMYLPAQSAAAQQTYNNPTSITLNVPDDLMVVQLAPAAASYPDLVVTNVGYTGNATNGAPVTFICTIQNIGPVSTPTGTQVAVGFYKSGASGPMSWGSIPGALAAGQTANITADFSVSVTPGVNNIIFWVDDVNRMAEANKNNNQMMNQFAFK